MRCCSDRGISHCIIIVVVRWGEGKLSEVPKTFRQSPPWTEVVSVSHSTRSVKTVTIICELLGSMIRSHEPMLLSRKSISFGWFMVEPKLCARRTKNFYLLFWFKRREMSVKWFRTSSSVLKSCCSMNHIYLHREPLSNAPASSNTSDIAQVASLARKGFKASWICTRGERDKQWTSSCILCMLWKWFAIYGRQSFASTLQWAHKEQPTFILFYVLSRGLLGMLGGNSNRAKLICAKSLLILWSHIYEREHVQ